MSKENNYEKMEKGFNEEFDESRMILYMRSKHDSEFKYLIRGSELRMSKRCDLHVPEIP